MVISSKANYKLLLGRKWIHGIMAVPAMLHQNLSIWHPDEIIENIEADQSYSMAEVNHVYGKHFGKNLARYPHAI